VNATLVLTPRGHLLWAAEAEAPALAASLAVQLLRGARLELHETTEICSRIMRIATSKGGVQQARSEALSILQAHPTQLGARMEFHEHLSRIGLEPAQQKASRVELQKSLDLTDQITRRDRARLMLWTIESLLAEGQLAEAEKRLAAAQGSITHPSQAGLWARNWRALVAGAQGKWPEAAAALASQAPTYASGRTAQHFLARVESYPDSETIEVARFGN